jgi:hypothetical protein
MFEAASNDKTTPQICIFYVKIADWMKHTKNFSVSELRLHESKFKTSQADIAAEGIKELSELLLLHAHQSAYTHQVLTR